MVIPETVAFFYIFIFIFVKEGGGTPPVTLKWKEIKKRRNGGKDDGHVHTLGQRSTIGKKQQQKKRGEK